eukprot:5803515-Pleurochrysis_carterae.AAC.1
MDQRDKPQIFFGRKRKRASVAAQQARGRGWPAAACCPGAGRRASDCRRAASSGRRPRRGCRTKFNRVAKRKALRVMGGRAAAVRGSGWGGGRDTSRKAWAVLG